VVFVSRFNIFLFGLVLFTTMAAQAEIRTISSMQELLPLVDQNTILVFDIDNTVLRPTQTFGSDQFFRYIEQGARDRGMTAAEAKAWALNTATAFQPRSPVVPVEQMTPELIRDYQERGITVFALTARPAIWADATVRQLRSLGVEFSKTAPARVDLNEGIHFQTPGGEKGPDLVKLLGRFRANGEKVVFVDDRPNNAESVDKALTATGVPNLSLRYSAADHWVNSFDARVAELQWQEFRSSGRFMTDKEALCVLDQPKASGF
jgi:hypothetical protein